MSNTVSRQELAFLLSPARCDGPRAKMLMNPAAKSGMAARLRSAEGAELGDVFSFLSALYFRGKLCYARAFTAPELHSERIKVITTSRGLLPASQAIDAATLGEFSTVDIVANDPRYIDPLRRDTETLADSLPSTACIVLLGSIATGKYVDTLLSVFGERLLFPAEFVGRGDMSRGGLLLRSARAGTALDYIPVSGAVRHGKRPPKLGKLTH